MAKVEITESLYEKVENKFKEKASEIFDLMEHLENNPKKGKFLGSAEGLAIKEIKYKGFRFYFIVDNYKIKFLSTEELEDLLIRFVRMSNKKEQQKTINEIKHILRAIGPSGFD